MPGGPPGGGTGPPTRRSGKGDRGGLPAGARRATAGLSHRGLLGNANPDPNHHASGEHIIQAILACGEPGVQAVGKRFAETGEEALAPWLWRLAGEGRVSLPAAFAEARRASRSFGELRMMPPPFDKAPGGGGSEASGSRVTRRGTTGVRRCHRPDSR